MDQNNNPSTQPPEPTPTEQPPTPETTSSPDAPASDSTPQNPPVTESVAKPVPPTPAPTPAPLQGAQAGTPITSLQQRNLLAAFLLTAYLGITGLHQVYLGRATQGWARFGLFIASFVLSFILIGYLIYPILFIWAAIDLLSIVFGKKVDGEGVPMAYTPRDLKWVKVMFFVSVALIVLWVFAIISLFAAFSGYSGSESFFI